MIFGTKEHRVWLRDRSGRVLAGWLGARVQMLTGTIMALVERRHHYAARLPVARHNIFVA